MNNTIKFIEGAYLDCSAMKDWKLLGKAVMTDQNEIVVDHTDGKEESMAVLSLPLNQKRIAQIRLQAESLAESVECVNAYDYSILQKVEYFDGSTNYLEWVPFNDGTLHYANYSAFTQGSHDWEKCSLVFMPEKPIRNLDLNLYFRNGTGKVRFRDVRLLNADVQNDQIFDTFPVQLPAEASGLYLRDIRQNPAEQIPMALKGEANQISWDCTVETKGDQQYYRIHLKSLDQQDHIFTVYYMMPLPCENDQKVYYAKDLLHEQEVCEKWDYLDICPWSVGANGLAAHFPFASAYAGSKGRAVGFDPSCPVFGRVGCNGAAQCLYMAADLALTAEKNEIDLLFNTFEFDGSNGLRSALDKYYQMFPEFYDTRIHDQGNWMAFVSISSLENHEDFGFKFKEGHEEPKWDREHDIYTFRYTEPLTCWVHMLDDKPSCKADAVNYVQKRIDQPGYSVRSHVIKTCSMHDVQGNDILILMDRPWCRDGAVWSINSMPGIPDEKSDFNLKWNKKIQEDHYTPNTDAEVSGEYIDSSEGYVSADISHRRDHFAYARLPLTYSVNTCQPGIFKGSIVYEYTKEMRDFMLPRGKYMMANGTPGAMWYLPPLLDVSGTETDWCINGKWAPITLEEFCYRRSACAAKPYCFLMNTNFKFFTHEMVEKYMKRSGAFGMFPSFFSADAASNHYFTQPDLYNRDRPLFKKYMPVIRRVAEAGWQPVTMAECAQNSIHLERFGTQYISVINDDKNQSVDVEIQLNLAHGDSCMDEYTGKVYPVQDHKVKIALEPEDVAILNLCAE